MKTLTTTNFKITPLTETDFAEILNMYKEPDSNKYVQPLLNKSDQEYQEFFERKLFQNQNSNGQGMWVIRKVQSNEFVGTCNLNKLHGTDWIQMGAHIGRNYWNKGVASEICKRILNHAFDDLKLDFVYGIFEPANVASKKLCLKLGFEFARKEKFMNKEVELYKCLKNS